MTEFHISYNLIHGLINTMFTYGYDRLLQQLTSNSAVQFTIMFYCKSSTKNDQTAVMLCLCVLSVSFSRELVF